MKSLVFAAFAFVGFLMLNSASAPSGYIVGDKAADFSLKNVDGTMVSLSDYKNEKGVIIVFTCNHCPYAQMYEQRIIDLHNKYKPKGFPVIAINPNSPIIVPEDSFEEMKKRHKEMKYPFPYLFDEDQTVYPVYGATRTPHVFILDSARTVCYIGGIDDNAELPSHAKNRWVENAVEAMLRGESPTPNNTVALGCTVKKKPD
ncbi:MAG: thioredoxin family protein [Saprospiraceae bacterium]|nr:thioredoxin family protein [Saprospiraceae bacterium]